jgi:hypothetical protein
MCAVDLDFSASESGRWAMADGVPQLPSAPRAVRPACFSRKFPRRRTGFRTGLGVHYWALVSRDPFDISHGLK